MGVGVCSVGVMRNITTRFFSLVIFVCCAHGAEPTEIMSYLNWKLNPDAGKSPTETGAIDNPKAPPAKHFKVEVLTPELSEPVALIVLPNERVLIAERAGALKEYDPATKQTTLAGALPVQSWDGKIAAEQGLLGIAADPNFVSNSFLYCYYTVKPSQVAATAVDAHSVNRLSRFVYKEGKLVLDSERVILELPTRLSDTAHEAGALAFGPDGLLYLSTGDNTYPFGPDASPMDPKKRSGDARRSAGNTNDLRGKILRIRIKPDDSYTIPSGNLFAPGTAKTRPEIYAMGVRNPYKISINRKTGTLYWAEVGPDKNPSAEEINQAKTPGFYGWPFFISDNLRFITPDNKLTDPLKVVNNSPFNTGLATIPLQPRKPLHQYNRSCSILGEVYHHQDGVGKFAFPKHFNNCLFYGDWNRSFIELIRLDDAENKIAVEKFPINFKFRKVIDLRFHKGTLYVLEYGDGWLGAKGGRLSKISYSSTFNQSYDTSADQRIAGMAQNHPGTQLLLKSTCLSCHSAQNKLVGPSFVELAGRYQASEATLKTLVGKVKNGGSGAWGKIAMPAHPQYSDTDVTSMLQAILLTEDLAAGHQQSISLFNGKDLSGWHKVGGTGKFMVENGVIRGHGIDIKGNTFLTTNKTYDNFILELEARFDMDELTNSGIQFRSHAIDKRLRGYQFEFDNGAATSNTGAVWDEYGTRGFISPFIPLPWIHKTDYDALMQKHGEAVKTFQTNTAKLLKKRDWNTIKIRCRDGRVQTWLNGIKQADFTDPEGAGFRSGVIGLQLHSGKRCEVSWRNIRITELESAAIQK